MSNFLPTLPPAILERCLAFSEQLYAMKPGTVKLEMSPSHFVFTMNQNPAKDSGDSLRHPSSLPKRKKTPSDLRRNALRKAEFLTRKNSIPQTEPENPRNKDIPPPPTAAKKVESKEDSNKDLLSESSSMDTSPVDVHR